MCSVGIAEILCQRAASRREIDDGEFLALINRRFGDLAHIDVWQPVGPQRLRLDGTT
jgi:hypothetical protein